VFPSIDSTTRHLLPSAGFPGPEFPWFHGTTKCSDFLPPLSPRFVAFAWRYHPSARVSPARGRALSRAGILELVTRYLRPGCCRWRRQDLLRSWGTPIVFLPCSPTPAGPTHQAMQCVGAAPTASTAKAPALKLSRLNHTASALAVYASQAGSPRHHARLASGCWPDSSGRAWLPAGFHRKVSRCILHLILLSQVQRSARTAAVVRAESSELLQGAPPSVDDGTVAEHEPAAVDEPIVTEGSPELPNPADIDVDDWEVAA